MVTFQFDLFRPKNFEKNHVQQIFQGELVWQQAVFYFPHSYVDFLNVERAFDLRRNELKHILDISPLRLENQSYVVDPQGVVPQTCTYPPHKNSMRQKNML